VLKIKGDGEPIPEISSTFSGRKLMELWKKMFSAYMSPLV
jgi:hypothetical protein